MDLKEQRRRRLLKLKYYKKQKDKGEKRFYTLEAGERCCNTFKDRGKRRYGFSRTSVRQLRRLSKPLIAHRKKNKIKCYSFNSYIKPSYLIHLLKDEKFGDFIGLIMDNYSDLNLLYEDYSYGYRDKIACRILSFSGLHKSDPNINADKFYDAVLDGVLKFIDRIDNYVEESGVSYYGYFLNIFPYRFLSSFSSSPQKFVSIEDIDEEPYYDYDYVLGKINDSKNCGITQNGNWRSLSHSSWRKPIK